MGLGLGPRVSDAKLEGRKVFTASDSSFELLSGPDHLTIPH